MPYGDRKLEDPLYWKGLKVSGGGHWWDDADWAGIRRKMDETLNAHFAPPSVQEFSPTAFRGRLTPVDGMD